MARVIVKQHGKVICSKDLEQGYEYIAGRAEDADIELASIEGISRHHIKFYFNGDTWVAELMSRFGQLICEGEAVEAVALEGDVILSVPPYEFTFQLKPMEEEFEKPDDITMDETIRNPESAQQAPVSNALSKLSDRRAMIHNGDYNEGNLDATAAGVSNLIAYLKVQNPEKHVSEILKLEGSLWIAGRESSCEIFLDNNHVSRKHFEITQTREGFFITDLGSANGTSLNGESLPANEPIRLVSGDKIAIMSVDLAFEVHDANFTNKLQHIPQTNWPVPPATTKDLTVPPVTYHHDPFISPQGPAVMKVDEGEDRSMSWPDRVKTFDFKKHKIRVASAILSLILLILVITDAPSQLEEKKQNLSSEAPPNFAALSEDQKVAVIDKYKLAKNLYLEGKYELCSTEIEKLHEFVPHYNDSKELEAFCRHGSDLRRQHEDQERKKRERRRVAQQITQITESCREKLNNNMTPEMMQNCLAPAIELNPEDPEVTALILEVEEIQRRQQEKEQAAEKRQRRIAAGDRQYKKARRYFEKGDLLGAIREFNAYLRGRFPDTKGYRTRAKRGIASAKQKLDEKVAGSLSTCKSSLESKMYKEAIAACDEALQSHPGHQEAKKLKQDARADLNQKMKDLYQDSILEESLGNVDAAQHKWQQILKEDTQDGDYHKKAKLKLKKYGVGL